MLLVNKGPYHAQGLFKLNERHRFDITAGQTLTGWRHGEKIFFSSNEPHVVGRWERCVFARSVLPCVLSLRCFLPVSFFFSQKKIESSKSIRTEARTRDLSRVRRAS